MTDEALRLANIFYEGNVFDKSKTEHLEECEKAKARALLAIDEKIATCQFLYNAPSISNEDNNIDFHRELNRLEKIKIEIQNL